MQHTPYSVLSYLPQRQTGRTVDPSQHADHRRRWRSSSPSFTEDHTRWDDKRGGTEDYKPGRLYSGVDSDLVLYTMNRFIRQYLLVPGGPGQVHASITVGRLYWLMPSYQLHTLWPQVQRDQWTVRCSAQWQCIIPRVGWLLLPRSFLILCERSPPCGSAAFLPRGRANGHHRVPDLRNKIMDSATAQAPVSRFLVQILQCQEV